MVGWGGQLGGIQNQPGGFDEKRLVTLLVSVISRVHMYHPPPRCILTKLFIL